MGPGHVLVAGGVRFAESEGDGPWVGGWGCALSGRAAAVKPKLILHAHRVVALGWWPWVAVVIRCRLFVGVLIALE